MSIERVREVDGMKKIFLSVWLVYNMDSLQYGLMYILFRLWDLRSFLQIVLNLFSCELSSAGSDLFLRPHN